MTAATGHPDDPPTPIGTFYGDPVAGIYGALGLLAALHERDRTGVGRHLELAQVEGILSMMPGPLMQASIGDTPLRSGDKSPLMAPHGFYRCAGQDTWVAIAVEDDARWADLRSLLRSAGHTPDEWSTLRARKAEEVELDRVVSGWTASLSPWQVTTSCQSAGVAAYPMMDAARLAWDHHLHQRDFFQWVEHPVTGPGPIPGVVFRVGDGGARVRGPAPTIGQHNEEVLCGLLGLTPDRYRQLVDSGAIATAGADLISG